MRYYRKIVGERLYLSPFNPDDIESYTKWAKWMNDKTVADTYGGYHNLVSLKSAKTTVAELIDYRFDIVLLDGDTLIGHISIHNIDHLNRNAFIGIVIGEEEHRRKGYGHEAIRLVLKYGFNTLNLHNIMLSANADNNAAIACYKKIGFMESGRRREWVFKNGKYIDKIYMDILAREFSSKT
ncbi:MAG: GNAT family N-acetyltransferase [Defluviitaleaceae bacterium]|nr:GNAT family N-acetyltransferase [Defluviitaleaceae bacterium]